jgi:Asp-tRNA(Asn)/Glu-tRNA(Gln) amidotransferase A subunit family amidase
MDNCSKTNEMHANVALGSMVTGAIVIPAGILTIVGSRTTKHFVPVNDVTVSVSSHRDGANLWLSGHF